MNTTKRRAINRQKITLKEWINEVGAPFAARLLSVDPSTVRHWRRGHCLPRPEQMKTIVEASRGRVTYDTIIEDFLGSHP